MRFLVVAVGFLFYEQLDTVAGTAVRAPFMGLSATAGPLYDVASLRSCVANNELKIPSGKPTNPEQTYTISCVPSNSHILDVETVKFESISIAATAEGVCDGLFMCTPSGTGNDVCSDEANPLTTGGDISGKAIFLNNRACLAEGTVSAMNTQGGSLRPRFVREGGLAKHSTNAFVRTIGTAIDMKLDDHLQTAPFLYGDDFKWDLSKTSPCTGCMISSKLYYKVQDNNPLNFELFPNTDCAWIFICFDFQTIDSNNIHCNRRTEIQLLLKNGVVTSGTRKTAYTLDLSSGRSIRIQRDDSTENKFTVTTGQNERIVISPFNTKTIAFSMSHDNCLEAPIMGLGTGTAVNPTTTDSNDFTPGPPPTGPTLKPVSAPTDPPTTEATAWGTAPPTTTDPPSAGSPKLAQGVAVAADPDATSAAFKGWLTWAYFYGSLCGTLTGFILCGVLFYLCRRTIYNNWYRGMYKRYGCDASGTTGGITGAEFGATTTAGNTTIGATTAGGTTGTSTTTGTTTGGTTTGGGTTTAGDQTTSGEGCKTQGGTYIPVRETYRSCEQCQICSEHGCAVNGIEIGLICESCLVDNQVVLLGEEAHYHDRICSCTNAGPSRT